MKRILVVLLSVMLIGCASSLKVAKIDTSTGYFPSNLKAPVVKNVSFDLDSRKSLILITDDDFTKGQIENIGYFDKVINHEDLEKIIIKEGLEENITTVYSGIALNKVAKQYKPFLWFQYNTRIDGNDRYAQFILKDPLTLEEIFITEKRLDFVWAGVTDYNTWYPMFNSFIDYIKENSKIFK